MKYLFAPWRSSYAHSKDDTKQKNTSEDICIFCKYAKKDLCKNAMLKNHVLAYYQHSAIVLNQFPYNAGHLLLVPYAHKATLEELTQETQTELIQLASKSCTILKEVLMADGINIGLNLGTAAGAGIPAHLHMHVLPRWKRDTGFMPTLADTKVISFDLASIYKQLYPAFNSLLK